VGAGARTLIAQARHAAVADALDFMEREVVLQGPTGSGKTYVAYALGDKACQQYRTVLYLPAAVSFDQTG
jgi:DNA replication protein DnaC